MGFTIAGARFILLVAALMRLAHVSAVPLSEFYSYGVSVGDQALPRSDDGSSPAIELEVPFRFFGRQRSTVFVSSACSLTERSTVILNDRCEHE